MSPSVYTRDRHGVAMEQFDQLPPRLRDLARRDYRLNVGLLLVAIDDGMEEDEVIEKTLNGTGWWML